MRICACYHLMLLALVSDSIASLKSIVSMGAQLSSEGCNLVSVAYKNKTGSLRKVSDRV